jgi:thiamine biosynthesis lipoprotein
MKARCQPLLGTFVEIAIEQENCQNAMDQAYEAIQQVQDLMSFHDSLSELNQINQNAHLHQIEIHPWTAQIFKIAQDIYQQSHGLFNCGIGHRLVEAGLLPRQLDLSQYPLGGIQDIYFLEPSVIYATKPVCLDLGGIAKGFAVDKAVEVLMQNGTQSGCVNAGGDLRVFGKTPRAIQIRHPKLPGKLIDIGTLQNGAIATSALYFANRDQQDSHIINPLTSDQNKVHLNFSESYSIVASECVYADALTKVLALCGGRDHPCFDYFNAQAITIAA